MLSKCLELVVVLEVCPSNRGFSGFVLVCMKNAGSEGTASVKEKLLSMRTTEAIVGLSAMSSWTHNKPMWMHLIMSRIESEPSLNVGSIKLEAVPSLQLFHA